MKLKRVQNYSNRQALVKICFIAIVLLFTITSILPLWGWHIAGLG